MGSVLKDTAIPHRRSKKKSMRISDELGTEPAGNVPTSSTGQGGKVGEASENSGRGPAHYSVKDTASTSTSQGQDVGGSSVKPVSNLSNNKEQDETDAKTLFKGPKSRNGTHTHFDASQHPSRADRKAFRKEQKRQKKEKRQKFAADSIVDGTATTSSNPALRAPDHRQNDSRNGTRASPERFCDIENISNWTAEEYNIFLNQCKDPYEERTVKTALLSYYKSKRGAEYIPPPLTALEECQILTHLYNDHSGAVVHRPQKIAYMRRCKLVAERWNKKEMATYDAGKPYTGQGVRLIVKLRDFEEKAHRSLWEWSVNYHKDRSTCSTCDGWDDEKWDAWHKIGAKIFGKEADQEYSCKRG